jgi:DNA-binding GntR family transcriptional regulator
MVKKIRRIERLNFEGAGLTQQISQTLIQAILNRTLRGGDQLVEIELQKRLGVSRSPLREAFRDLEKKGLVVIKPRRGTFVKKIARQDIEEHYPVLAALEGLAAQQGPSSHG